MKLSYKVMFLVSILLLFELVFLGVLAFLLDQAETDVWRESHARAVVAESNNLLKLYYEASAALLTYGATKSAFFGQRFEAVIKQIPDELQFVDLLVLQSEKGRISTKRLDNAALNGLKLLVKGKNMLDKGNQSYLADTARLKGQIEEVVKELVSESNAFANSVGTTSALGAEARSRLLVKQCLMTGVAVNVCIALALVLFFTRGITRRLQTLIDNSVRLAKGESLHAPQPGGDEISKLDHVFHEMAKSLAEAAQRKQDFVTMITHDIRTPLGSIRGTLNLLEAGVFGSLSLEACERIKAAENCTQQLIDLINQLLDIEKLEAGMLRLDVSEVPLTKVTERAAQAVRTLAEQKQISIELNVSEINIAADSDRLCRVIINLLSNAIKFSPNGSPIQVSNETVEDWVEVRITDRGRGVPERFQDAIFERFKQVAHSDATEKGGTGLGLPICKAIIKEHGGTIGVKSKEGEGSTFWFRVPISSSAHSPGIQTTAHGTADA